MTLNPAPSGDSAGNGLSLTGGDISSHLLERQVRAAAPAAGWSNVAHAVAFAFAGLFIIPPGEPLRAIVWTLAGVLLCFFTVVVWTRSERRGPRRIVVEMWLSTGLFSALWAVAAAWTFPNGTSDTKILLSGLIGGIVGCGAITLSTLRSVGMAWVLGISAGPAVVFLLQGSAGMDQLAALLGIYDIAMVVGVVYLSASFSARCRAEEMAESERQKLNLVFREFEGEAQAWLWETDPDGRFVQVSDRFAQVSSQPADVLSRLTVISLIEQYGSERQEDALRELAAAFSVGQPFRRIQIQMNVAGELRWWDLSGKPREDGRGWRGIGSDTTNLKSAQEHIERLGTVDVVSGLPNRHACNEELAERLGRADAGMVTYLGIIDLDNFKSVNDTLGHPVGDRLIAGVADALLVQLEPGEFCGRLGGDEFALLLAEGVTPAGARSRFHQIHAAIKGQAYPDSVGLLDVTSSIGVADSGQLEPVDALSMVVAADLALYAAKSAGRDQVVHYTAELGRVATDRAQLIRELTSAVERKEFELYWQPQSELLTGDVVGMEALVRWNRPDQGLTAPGLFIQAAEESGLIVPIGQMVMAQALRSAAEWPAALRISVNVSPRELLSKGFAARVLDQLDLAGFPADRLVLEVTETVLTSAEGRSTLHTLRRHGISIAMDDFGTGYSSFGLLRKMPVDEIKIDRTFVESLTQDVVSRTFVSTIITMAATLDLRVIAEGVETIEQRDHLAYLGCRQIQGFLRARPMPASQVPHYLRSRRPATADLGSASDIR